MADSKWLTEIRCDDAIENIAAVALRARLATVRKWAALAGAKQPTVESVHQLRVAARRARAALKFFAPVLPSKRTKSLHKSLRRLRRAAGPARDLDVMLDRLSQELGDQAATKNSVFKQWRKERKLVQPELVKQLKALTPDLSGADLLAEKVRWRGTGQPPSWVEFVQDSLNVRFQVVMVHAEARPRQIGAIHKLRIQGKRLRYALELAVSVDPAIRSRLYPTMAAMQEKLGDINDVAVAIEHLKATELEIRGDKHAVAVCRELMRDEQERLDSLLAGIDRWWESDPLGDFERSWYAIFSQGRAEGAA